MNLPATKRKFPSPFFFFLLVKKSSLFRTGQQGSGVVLRRRKEPSGARSLGGFIAEEFRLLSRAGGEVVQF